MTTRESLIQYVEERKKREKQNPIYRILIFENPDKELVFDGKPAGFPDIGNSADIGFYYDLDDAIFSMAVNNADMQERCYFAGFILCHFPGLYESAGSYERMYFIWDEKKHGFYQAEEPDIFAHVAY